MTGAPRLPCAKTCATRCSSGSRPGHAPATHSINRSTRYAAGSAVRERQHTEVTTSDVSPEAAKSRRPVAPTPLKALLPRVRPYRWRLFVCAVCLLVAAAVGLAFPAVVQRLLDAAFQKHDRALLDRIALLLVGA